MRQTLTKTKEKCSPIDEASMIAPQGVQAVYSKPQTLKFK